MRFVLLKLRDTWLEAKAADEKRQHAPAKANGRGSTKPIAEVVASVSGASPVEKGVTDEEVEEYFADRPSELQRIKQDVERGFTGWPKNAALVKTADQALKRALREAYDAAHSPAGVN